MWYPLRSSQAVAPCWEATQTVFKSISSREQEGYFMDEPVWPNGKAIGRWKADLGSNLLRLSFLFKSCGLWTLSCDFVTHKTVLCISNCRPDFHLWFDNSCFALLSILRCWPGVNCLSLRFTGTIPNGLHCQSPPQWLLHYGWAAIREIKKTKKLLSLVAEKNKIVSGVSNLRSHKFNNRA